MNALARLSVREVVQSLREQMRLCRVAAGFGEGDVVPSGLPALDGLLPERGFRRGTLVEWLAASCASGTSTLALLAARQACRSGGALVVVDRERCFYPPAAANWGIDLAQMIVVRPANERDEAWSVDQALRCSGVAAVLAWPEKLNERTFRRWQLAAESGGVLGLLMRSESARRQPSWAELRLLVSPLPTECGASRGELDARRLRVELLHCRGGLSGGKAEVQMNAELTRTG